MQQEITLPKAVKGNSMPRFDDQVIWITGASSGIGEAVARELAPLGPRLILSARREAELERVARELSTTPDRVFVLPMDLEDHDSLAVVARHAENIWGKVDIMIHNAGISQRSLVAETSLEVDRRLINLNYLGTVALTKALLPSMLKRRNGHFVVVTSVVGKLGTPLRSSYAASKHALHGFFDSMRAELEDQGILVTLACPGYIRTAVSLNALTANGTPQARMDEAQAKGMAPEVAAKHLVRAIAEGRREVAFGGREIYALYLKRFFPGILANMLKKAKVT